VLLNVQGNTVSFFYFRFGSIGYPIKDTELLVDKRDKLMPYELYHLDDFKKQNEVRVENSLPLFQRVLGNK